MMNSTLGDLDAAEFYNEYVNITYSYEYEEGINLYYLIDIIFKTIMIIAWCFGLLGNGFIIWLLSFQIKRNSFTTFILNLAFADFGFLLSILLFNVYKFAYFLRCQILYLFFSFFFHLMYITSNLLLTAISIDRCVAVLFPIWHHLSRPKHLSSVVCVLLWISSSLLSGIMQIKLGRSPLDYLHFLVTAVVCFPLITISTLVLFIEVCLKSNQRNQGRLLLMILITLLCFLILAFPLCVLVLINFFYYNLKYHQMIFWLDCCLAFSCLNSSINPVIYFLVGRRKGARSKESMKVILQNVFKEGEATGGR